MKTVFKKGMKVYDQLLFPDKEGKVISIVESDDFPIKVHYEELEINELSYTADGRYYTDIKATLATKPYIFEGFEQKAHVPTYEEAVNWIENNKRYNPAYVEIDEKETVVLSETYFYAFEALRKLIILRDYYNDGWQPDWKNDDENKYVILTENDKIKCEKNYSYKRVLYFKTSEIRDKFLEEQRELLEIAKPLL